MITKHYRIIRYPTNKLVIHEVYLDGAGNVLEIEEIPLAISGFSKEELLFELDKLYESMNEAVIPSDKAGIGEYSEDYLTEEIEDSVDFFNRNEF